MNFHAISQRPLVGMSPLVEWQKGRVDIDHFPCPWLQQHRCHDAHESGASDQIQIL